MKHIWTIICNKTQIEALTNNLSIIDVYENVQFQLNPPANYDGVSPIAVPFVFEIISLFEREKADNNNFETLLEVYDPKSQKLGEVKSSGKFLEDQKNMRNIFKFNTIAITTTGVYSFKLHIIEEGKKKLLSNTGINIDVSIIQ